MMNIETLVSKELAWHYRVVPKDKNDEGIVCYIDETQDAVLVKNELEILLGSTITFLKETSSEIEKKLLLTYRKEAQGGYAKEDSIIEEIVREAIYLGSSDIHFECYESFTRVRYRIDGYLIEKRRLKAEIYAELVNVIKIKSNLDITEKRLPQDGRTSLYDNDIRVAIIPTQFGEKIVLRILGKDANALNLVDLGFDNKDLKKYLESVKKTNGIVLISGPTGSGKTTTLYATLKILNKVDKNIMTIEDPIEYILEGINQTQLNEEIGLTFSVALKSFLRQDPDIIMLGEIRDKATAEMAMRASLTGHLVLTTIHTNSALGTISRLLDMGVPPFIVSETLNIALAQRLVRVLCSCKKKQPLKKEELPESFEVIAPIKEHYVEVGCESCHFTGYKGRKAIYELVIVDNDITKAINDKQDFAEIIKEKGIETLGSKAYKLLEKGETSLKEIYPILINAS